MLDSIFLSITLHSPKIRCLYLHATHCRECIVRQRRVLEGCYIYTDTMASDRHSRLWGRGFTMDRAGLLQEAGL